MGSILEFVPRCSRHSQSRGEGPQCFSRCLEEVEAALASKSATVTKPKASAKPKASGSRWAEYGRRGGRVRGIKASPAAAVAAKVNGARGGRPRKAGSR